MPKFSGCQGLGEATPINLYFFGALHPYFSSVCLAWTGLWAGAKTKQKSNSKGKQKNESGGNAAQRKRGEWAGQRPVSRIDQKKVLTAGQKSFFFCPLCWPECRPEKSLVFFFFSASITLVCWFVSPPTRWQHAGSPKKDDKRTQTKRCPKKTSHPLMCMCTCDDHELHSRQNLAGEHTSRDPAGVVCIGWWHPPWHDAQFLLILGETDKSTMVMFMWVYSSCVYSGLTYDALPCPP